MTCRQRKQSKGRGVGMQNFISENSRDPLLSSLPETFFFTILFLQSKLPDRTGALTEGTSLIEMTQKPKQRKLKREPKRFEDY